MEGKEIMEGKHFNLVTRIIELNFSQYLRGMTTINYIKIYSSTYLLSLLIK